MQEDGVNTYTIAGFYVSIITCSVDRQFLRCLQDGIEFFVDVVGWEWENPFGFSNLHRPGD
jgi:hypothetical protein